MGSFSGIEIGLTGLEAFQTALGVIGNNITNASTPGYTRQKALLVSLPGNGELNSPGGGVSLASITRVRDEFMDAQVRGANAGAQGAQYYSDSLAQLENVVNPLASGGLSSQINTFWQSLQNFSNNPTDAGARAAVASGASALAQALNGQIDGVDAAITNLTASFANQLSQANSDLASIAQSNQSILSGQTLGRNVNSLLDARDATLNSAAGLLGVTITPGDAGITVSLEGVNLVSGATVFPLSYKAAGAGNQTPIVQVASTGQTVQVSSGVLGGLSQAISDGEALKSDLENLRATLASMAPGSLNAIHSSGYTASGSVSGQPLFVLDGSGALAANPAILSNPSLLAAAQSASAGDGSNALALATALKAPMINGHSAADYLASITTQLGAKASTASSQASLSKQVYQAAQAQQSATSGVNLDEETVNLINMQQAYAASARYITIANSVFTDLLNLVT